MDAVQSVVLGLIQGFTEFFPISSSAHLLLSRALFPLGEASLSLDVLLHAGTWVAVLLAFSPVLSRVLRNPAILGKVLIATIPAGIFGYLFEEKVEKVFRGNLVVVSIVLILVGFVLLFARERQDKTLETMTVWDALLVGMLQALALIPGVSRSGITILGGIGVGLKRTEAVFFSFLLSLTTIGGAVVLVLGRHGQEISLLQGALFGFLAALGSGIFSCVVLLKLVREKGLAPFGYYRIAVGAFFLVFLFLEGIRR